MIWNDSRRSLTLRLAKGSRTLPPLKRNIEVRVVGEKASRSRLRGGPSGSNQVNRTASGSEHEYRDELMRRARSLPLRGTDSGRRRCDVL